MESGIRLLVTAGPIGHSDDDVEWNRPLNLIAKCSLNYFDKLFFSFFLFQAKNAFKAVYRTSGSDISNLMGGMTQLFLLFKRIITWHIPAGMLLALFLLAGYFNTAVDADTYPGVMHHLLSGGTMLGAFFIATDPVSAATSNRGKIIFGFLIGVLTYVIRTWGGYPDAVAFSVLLMNLAAPTLDYYTQPRTYGHRKPNKGLAKPD